MILLWSFVNVHTTFNKNNCKLIQQNGNSSVLCFPVTAHSIVAHVINMHVIEALQCLIMRAVLIVF